LRYMLQYKTPSKSVQIQLKVDNKKLFPFNDFENPKTCGENWIKKKGFFVLFEILFLWATVEIAAVHIKAGGCFSQYSKTKYTKNVNHSHILFKFNTFWPIFAHHQVNLHYKP
jgi:uncharacterized membrane protein